MRAAGCASHCCCFCWLPCQARTRGEGGGDVLPGLLAWCCACVVSQCCCCLVPGYLARLLQLLQAAGAFL